MYPYFDIDEISIDKLLPHWKWLDNMYVADLYEYVSLIGDLHEQIKEISNGGQVRRIEPHPEGRD